MKIFGVLGCLCLLILCGCGGGGGESTALGSVFQKSRAVITVSIPPLPNDRKAEGVELTIQLPTGVTPAVFSGNDATGSLALTGGNSGSLPAANYNAIANTIRIANISVSGVGTGDILVINCVLGSNTTVTAGDFTLFDGSISDTVGVIPGVTPTISVVFR